MAKFPDFDASDVGDVDREDVRSEFDRGIKYPMFFCRVRGSHRRHCNLDERRLQSPDERISQVSRSSLPIRGIEKRKRVKAARN